MEFTASQIAAFFDGQVEGDPDVRVNDLAKIEEGRPQAICFLDHEKYNHYLYDTDASVVIIGAAFQLERPVKSTCTLIRVKSVRECFAKVMEMMSQQGGDKKGIEQPSYVADSATLGEDVYVGAFAYIGEHAKIGKNVKIYPRVYVGDYAEIGDDCVLKPGVHVNDKCVLGNRCVIHNGTVIGSDGFGFVPDEQNRYQKVVHAGNVVIEDDVEIGANTTIDRGTMGSTRIEQGVKLDNLIQVAHNVVIGENTVIAAQAGIAGSAVIGKNCMIGGQVGMIGHIKIADGTKIVAQSGISKAIEDPDQIMMGSPALPIREYQKSAAVFKKLPQIKDQVSEVARDVAELKQTKSTHGG